MRIFIFLLFLASPAPAQECPVAPDHSVQMSEVLEQFQATQSEARARELTGVMWGLLFDAPDAKAQDLLDHGIKRREAYDYAAALVALDELVAYCPEYAEGYNQRAFVAYLRQDFAQALEDLDRALKITPTHVPALSGKALTLLGLGRTAAAQAILRKAVALNPWLPERGLLIKPQGEDI